MDDGRSHLRLLKRELSASCLYADKLKCFFTSISSLSIVVIASSAPARSLVVVSHTVEQSDACCAGKLRRIVNKILEVVDARVLPKRQNCKDLRGHVI